MAVVLSGVLDIVKQDPTLAVVALQVVTTAIVNNPSIITDAVGVAEKRVTLPEFLKAHFSLATDLAGALLPKLVGNPALIASILGLLSSPPAALPGQPAQGWQG